MQSKFSEMPMWTIIVILGTLIFGSLLILGLYVREQLYVISGATVLSSFIAFASLVVVNKYIQGAMWKRDLAYKKIERVYAPLYNWFNYQINYLLQLKDLPKLDSERKTISDFYKDPLFLFIINSDKQLREKLNTALIAIDKYNKFLPMLSKEEKDNFTNLHWKNLYLETNTSISAIMLYLFGEIKAGWKN